MSRLGLGLAAVGRPAYLNLGHAADLPGDRTVDALRGRTFDLLDQAYAGGIRYVDAARSYGRAEEFLAAWLAARPDTTGLRIGSKWGYTYVGDWRVDAEVHEVKDHGVAQFDRQLAETRALLGTRLDLYQIHSLTLDSPALTDTALHHRLARLAAEGVVIGFSASGPAQPDTIRAALAVTVDGAPLFRSVQATWNLLEPSAGPALAEAAADGCAVIIKEAMANGRLAADAAPEPLRTLAAELGAGPDAVALAAALQQPWAPTVLSGAATTAQLAANLRAETLILDPAPLSSLAEPPAAYWAHRSRLPWT